MSEPVIVSAAVVGGEHGREATPHIPITPEEIARSAHEAHLAGAAIVHLHVRDDAGRPTHDLERYRWVVDYLRARCDAIVNLTTDPGGTVSDEDRPKSLELSPELATFDAGTLSSGDRIVTGTDSFLRNLARRMQLAGTKPELEIFHSGMIGTCLRLIEEGLVDPPPYFQFVLGVGGCAPADPRELLRLVDALPAGAPWSVAGLGRSSVAMVCMGLMLGGHVRVGLEDQVYFEHGVLAKSNAELVERAVALAAHFGRPVATPAQAREILGLERVREQAGAVT
jgi:3-keto-5-aminohexanoate cleavage enzyme